MTSGSGTYRGYGVRQPIVTMVQEATDMARPLSERLAERTAWAEAEAASPFVGVTTDGNPITNLFPLQQTGHSTAPIKAAADAFLAALPDGGRAACFPIDAPEWRMWLNGIGPRID